VTYQRIFGISLPDVSETDEENTTGKRKIVTKDLAWRSATVSKNDRNYFDIN